MDAIDEIKVHVVVALCEELRDLEPHDPRYVLVVDKLESRWEALLPLEQAAVEQLLIQRDLPRVRRGVQVTK
jgi:hypothetical protein